MGLRGDERQKGCIRTDSRQPYVAHRAVKTLAIYISVFCIGLTMSVIGPTQANLVVLFNTDIKTMGKVLVAKSIGFLAGSILLASVFRRINSDVLIGLTSLMTGLCAVMATSTGTLYAYAGCLFGFGIGATLIIGGGKTYAVHLWNGHRYKEPLVQAIYSVFSGGCVLGPLVIRPFLVSLPLTHHVSDSSSNNSLIINSNSSSGNVSEKYAQETVANFTQSPDINIVRYAYYTTAIPALPAAGLFFALFLLEGHKFSGSGDSPRPRPRPAERSGNAKPHPRQSNEKKTTTLAKKTTARWYLVAVTTLTFLFGFSYAPLEAYPTFYLSLFAIRAFGWSVQGGSLLASVFFACMSISRVVSIFLAFHVDPGPMLVGGFAVTTAGFALLSLSPYVPAQAMIWVSVALVGFGAAFFVATMYNFISLRVPVSVMHMMASAIYFGYGLGEVCFFPLMGYLFQESTPMWMAYVALICVGVTALIFFATHLLTSKHVSVAREEMSVDIRERQIENAMAADRGKERVSLPKINQEPNKEDCLLKE